MTELLKPKDAARIVGVHPNTLAQWCDDAEGAAGESLWKGVLIRLPSGHRRYRKNALERALRGNDG